MSDELRQEVAELKTVVVQCRELLEILMLRQSRTHYTVAEFAKVTGWSEYSVREWCKSGKIKADKTKERHGAYATWRIPHSERVRFTRELTGEQAPE